MICRHSKRFHFINTINNIDENQYFPKFLKINYIKKYIMNIRLAH
ncbi:hypothetical protein NTHI1209_01405 [Haemophilus influenzae]|uniref:Uncharacterized protein n=1 Tax=Haemophilus influenzae TaxID=727 RepID=A0A158SY49_HAEIF|nr:hypothetical protein NTHI1209_01405 [Haemophilus influenzae]